MQRTALSLVLLGVILGGTAPTLHSNCRSCEVRSASHRDDLSQTGYYEDSQYFQSSQRQSENKETDAKKTEEAQTPQAPLPRNTVRKSKEARIRSANVQQYVAPQNKTVDTGSGVNQTQPQQAASDLPENTSPVEIEIEAVEQK